MRIDFQKLAVFILTFTLITPPAYALDLSSYSLLNDKKLRGLQGSEFVSGNQPGVVLMRVNLWGAVLKPGVHFIPAKTDLITLLSYAGGPKTNAILDEVIIKRQTDRQHKRIKVDIDQLLNEASSHRIPLEPNDIVMIRADKPLISSDTVQVVSIIGGIGAIILTALIISDRNK